jgi:tripeptide aminopeptidase
LFREGAEKIDAFIAIDGGSVERLINGGIGSHRYRLMYSGPGGHSWGAFGLANPHHALGRAIAIFDKEALKVTTTGDKTTYNIGRIGGGTSINSIPFESWAEIDMRSGNQSKLDEIDAVLQMAAQQALNEENLERTLEPKITYELTRIGTRPAGQGDPNSSLVQHAVASMQKLGLEAQFSSSSTDANIPISLGIPAITISRGGVSKRSHSLDESWQNIDSHVAIQIALLTLVAEAGLSEN